MSMHESPIYTNGYVIDVKTQALMTRLFLLADPSQACEEDLKLISNPLFVEKVVEKSLPDGFIDACWLQEQLSARGIACVYHGNFSGRISTLDELSDAGLVAHPPRFHFDNEELLYVPLVNEPSLLNAAYENVAAIIQEVKQKLQPVLPDELFAVELICSIRGAILA